MCEMQNKSEQSKELSELELELSESEKGKNSMGKKKEDAEVKHEGKNAMNESAIMGKQSLIAKANDVRRGYGCTNELNFALFNVSCLV